MFEAVYWRGHCQGVFKATSERQLKVFPCLNCGSDSKYLSTDARPVFARERRILQFYGHGPLLTEQVWRSSRATSYFVDGELVRLPGAAQLKSDLAAIGNFIADSDHYDKDRNTILPAVCSPVGFNSLARGFWERVAADLLVSRWRCAFPPLMDRFLAVVRHDPTQDGEEPILVFQLQDGFDR